jgi:hypothetical protein
MQMRKLVTHKAVTVAAAVTATAAVDVGRHAVAVWLWRGCGWWRNALQCSRHQRRECFVAGCLGKL